MDTPNPELMHAYGTDAHYLKKVGAFTDVLRIAAPVAWMGLLAHNHAEDERHRAEAEAMNLSMRAAEAERMRPALQGFYGHHVPMQPMQQDYSDPDEAIQAAQDLGKFSHVGLLGLGKTAASGAVSGFVSRALSELIDKELEGVVGLGKPTTTKVAESLGRSLAHQELVKQALFGFGKKPAAAPTQPIWASMGSGGGGGPYRTAATPAPSIPPPAPTPTGPITSIKDPRFQAAPGHIAGEGLSDFKTGPWQAKGQKLLNNPAHMAGKTFTPTPGAPGAPAPKVPTAGLPKPKMPGAAKPWVGRGTMLKGLGALGIGAAAYGGYKLINKAKQKMDETHSGGHAWGQAAPPMYTGVSEYGHPVY